jgi:hypothetical protein
MILPVGAFIEGKLYPSWMHFFSKPFIAFILSFIDFLFLFLFQGLTRGHCLGMVTKVDSVTHKHFHRDDRLARDETPFPLVMQPKVTSLAW